MATPVIALTSPHLMLRGGGPVAMRAWSAAICVACMATPWLNTFSAGPAPSVLPWLVTLACTAVLVAVAGMRRIPASLAAAVLGITAFAAWRSTGGLSFFGVIAAGVMMLGAVAAGASLGASVEGRRCIVQAIVLAAVLSSVLALLQYAGLAQEARWWMSASSDGEAYANLRQRNQLASLTVMGLCVTGWLASQRTRMRWVIALVICLAFANAATTSRTGLVQLLVLGGVAAVVPGPARSRRLLLFAVAIASYAAGAVLLPVLAEALHFERATSLFTRVTSSQACSSRTVLWANVFALIAERPALGWGWGELDYAHFVHLYGGPRFCDILDNAHSLPLHLAVELGVPFAGLCVAVAAWATFRARPWQEKDPMRLLAWSLLAALALHSLVEYPLWYGPFQLTLGLSLGVLCASRAQPLTQGRALRLSVPCIALPLLAFVTWDYWRVGQAYIPPNARAPGYVGNTLERGQDTWFFAEHAHFATLTTSPLTQDNAKVVLAQARALLHFSPEPSVIEKFIESAFLLHRTDEAAFAIQRYRVAFPRQYQAWATRSGAHP